MPSGCCSVHAISSTATAPATTTHLEIEQLPLGLKSQHWLDCQVQAHSTCRKLAPVWLTSLCYYTAIAILLGCSHACSKALLHIAARVGVQRC